MNRIGVWSARTVVGVGLAYLVVLIAGMARYGLRAPITGGMLAIMEGLTLLSAPPLVALVAAVVERARPARQLAGQLAVVCASLFAGTTMAVHFVSLTLGSQLSGGSSSGTFVWPSTAYALELLAWDVFLGLALVIAATTLDDAGDSRARQARRALVICGALCLAGTAGPVLGNMRLQFIGVFGYAVVLPVTAVLLLRLFAADRAGSPVAAA